MERRKQSRIQLPLEVDLRHPFIGLRTVVARDMNDEGVFAWYPDAPFKVGSSIDVTLRCKAMIESTPTPTVKMQVSRIDDNGLVLSFCNKSGAHLWRSATVAPQELDIGRDLFRIFQAAIVRDSAGRILTVQQNGRWLYPGAYLHSGEHAINTLQDQLARVLNLTGTQFRRTVLTYCDPDVVAIESSTMSVFHLFTLSANDTENQNPKPSSSVKVVLSEDSTYTKVRWLDRLREIDEMSFSAEPLRELARSLLHTDEPPRSIRAPRHTHLEEQDSGGVDRKNG